MPPEPLGGSPFILVENVTKEYRSGSTVHMALKNVSLEIGRGEFVALVGPSGSGKTTLIHLISGLDTPTRGRVVVGGVEISSMGEASRARWRRRNVGIVFQFLHLVPTLTALENIMLPMELAGVPRRERRERALKLLEFVGLADKASRLPSELSGGEQQRIAVARALAAGPPLLVADEPTANLDRRNKFIVMELLERAAMRGVTVVYTTHDQEVAELARKRVALRDGKIVGVEG